MLLALLDWIPVRLTALSFAIVGDFEDAVACWRTQAHRGRGRTAASPSASCWRAAAARSACNSAGRCRCWSASPDVRAELGIGEPAGPDMLPSAVGLVWRALVLWLLLILLLTLANIVP